MKQKIDFLLAGVGGQGTLLASNILAEVGLRAGYDVKKSEVHGMAQRGGSVTSHVRWGNKVYSPLIGQGEVDYLLSFERLETLRYIEHLRPGGTVLVNDHAIPPISVTAGKDTYPDDKSLQDVLAQVTKNVQLVPAMTIAEELGNARVANIVLLGVLSAHLEIPAEVWLSVIADIVPAKHAALNQTAFEKGRTLAK